MNQLSDEVKAVANKIGEFYLIKNKHNVEKAREEIESLQIQEITVTPERISISLVRVGILIGKKGNNVRELNDFLCKHLHIVEAENMLLNELTRAITEYEYGPLLSVEELDNILHQQTKDELRNRKES